MTTRKHSSTFRIDHLTQHTSFQIHSSSQREWHNENNPTTREKQMKWQNHERRCITTTTRSLNESDMKSCMFSWVCLVWHHIHETKTNDQQNRINHLRYKKHSAFIEKWMEKSEKSVLISDDDSDTVPLNESDRKLSLTSRETILLSRLLPTMKPFGHFRHQL
jgi:transcriptional regulator with PAS, ATPase and Fis domain